MQNSRSCAMAICLTGMALVTSVLSPALAGEGAEVQLIFGSGFKPSNLTEGSLVSGDTLIVADKETIVVLRSVWKVKVTGVPEVTRGDCEDWVILRGRQHRIPSSLPTTCPERGHGDEVALAMGGKSMKAHITVLQYSHPNADNATPKILKSLYGDLQELKQKAKEERPAAGRLQYTPLKPEVVVYPRPKVSCAKAVQGKIAWDYKGNKRWASNNVARLCNGAKNSTEPAKCFNTVMHRGVKWGGGTKWDWKNAIDLCEGSQNARKTVGCFKLQIRKNVSWSSAIKRCS